jgi:PAS domain S-box-containing protein
VGSRRSCGRPPALHGNICARFRSSESLRHRIPATPKRRGVSVDPRYRVDITDRREAELSLRESEERFRQLADNIDEAFWMTDPAGKMLYVSSGYERIFGRPVPEIYDAPASWMECILPEDRGRVREAALTRQTSGEYHEEYRIRLPDNSIRWILDRAFRSATRHETCIGLSAWLKT